MLRVFIQILMVALMVPHSVAAGLVIKSSAPSFVCGTSTVNDADGNTYTTVLVNDQCWMGENLRVGVKLASATTDPADNGIIEKWCYNNDDAICLTDGGLYRWDEAMQYVTSNGAQGICPSGWHIPTGAQQYTLENYLKDDGQACNPNRIMPSGIECFTAGTKLKVGGSSGMNFVIAGNQYNYPEYSVSGYVNRNSNTVILGSTLWDAGGGSIGGVGRIIFSSSAGIGMAPYGTSKVGMSIRCLKD